MRSNAGSTAQRREVDFWVCRANFGGLGDAVALFSSSHARGDRGRLRKVVVMSRTREDAGEWRLQWEWEVVLRENVWVLGC